MFSATYEVMNFAFRNFDSRDSILFCVQAAARCSFSFTEKLKLHFSDVMDFLKTKTMARSQATPSELKNEIPSFDKDETLTETFLRAVPKVEIHVHLDGCFDPNELWKHLQSHPELVQCIPVEKKLPWDTNPESRPFKFREKITSCKTSLDFTGLCICRKRYRAPSQAGGRKQQSRSATESLEKMLLCFEFFLPLVYDNFDLLEYLALDFVKRQGEQNVIYTEVR